MWADESVYGPPAPGSKVGDFIQTWLMSSWDCGVFTHREIAQRLMDTFTGLKIKELAWFENPREKTLKNGKPRARRAKWLPEREVDLVYLYVDMDERWLFDLAKDPEGRKPTVTWQTYNRGGVLYGSYDEMFISLLPLKVENPELKRVLWDYFRIRSQKKKVAKSITVYKDAAERFGGE